MNQNWDLKMNDKSYDELEPDLARKMGLLLETPQRDPQASARGRANYLTLSRSLARERAVHGAVSTAPFRRLNGWMQTIFNRPPGKESYSMLTTIVSIALAFTLLFGGAGVTAYAAQDSLPSEVLYPLKTMGEDLRLELASGEQAQFELALAYANRRMGEISAMLGAGEPLGEQVGTRLQDHLNLALRLAARMSEQDMEQALLRIRQQIQEQLRTMEMLQSKAPEQDKGALERIQAMFQAQNRMAELGLEDPLAFRLHFQQGAGQDQDPGQEPSGNGQGNGPGPQEEPSDNGQGNGPGPQQEPSGNGQGNGPGPQQEPSYNGQGSGPGPQQEPSGNGQGNGPGPQQEPSNNGQGNGPGPQQEPSGNGQGDGPQQEPPVTDRYSGPGSQQEPPISNPATQPEPSGSGQGGSGSGGGGH